MAFLPLEQSNYGGEPVYLYEFKRGPFSLRYASCDRDITANGFVWTATAISNQGFTQKGTAVTDVFQISVPRTMEVASWYRYTAPSDIVYVFVRKFHYGDTEAAVEWIGQIVSVAEGADESALLKCHAVSVTLKRGGLRLSWQRGCIHALYDQNCTVDKSAYAFNTTISVIGPFAFTVATPLPTSAWWPGGFFQWTTAEGILEQRFIEDYPAPNVIPYGQMDGYSIGLALTFFPGCKRTSPWCQGFFNNLANFGGYEFMPNRTPYDGWKVF